MTDNWLNLPPMPPVQWNPWLTPPLLYNGGLLRTDRFANSQARAFALKSEHFLIGGAICLYLFFSLRYLELPGLYYDELQFANAALGNIDGSFIHGEVAIGDIRIPLMLMDYVGALKAWIYAPVFALFGASVATARVPVILIGLLTLGFTYGIIRTMLGRGVAVLATILFATDPTFIFANKLDWGPVSLMLCLKMAALFSLVRWLRRGGLFWCGAGGFLLGLGLFNKIIFIWAIAAIAFAFVACFAGQLRARADWKSVALTGGLFLLGCLPLIAFNVEYPLQTFRDQRIVTRDRTWPEDIRYRHGLFQQTLDGRAVHDFVARMPLSAVLSQPAKDYLGRGVAFIFRRIPLDRTLLPYAALTSLALLAVLWRWHKPAMPRATLFFVLLLLVISALIFLTAQATGPHHVLILYPDAHVIAAAAFVCLWNSAAHAALRIGRLGVRVITAAAVGALLFSQLLVGCGFLKSFQLYGGTGYWSDAIYQLSDYGKQRPGTPLILMDWGFATQLLLLSNGKQRKEEAFFYVFGGSDTRDRIGRMYPWMISPGAVFVFHPPQIASYPAIELFHRALSEYQLSARELKVFYQRDGQPVYSLFEVVRPELESHLRSGRFFYFREAEDWDFVRGGGREPRATASLLMTLGDGWGARNSDVAAYKVPIDRDVPGVMLYARFEAAGKPGYRLCVSVDGLQRGVFDLPSAPAAGDPGHEWQTVAVQIGLLRQGAHEFRIAPESGGRAVNMDCFYLAEGEFTLHEVTRMTELAERGSLPLNDANLSGLQENVRPPTLTANAPVMRAGRDTLILRVGNLDVPAIDVQYTLDGKTMPVLQNWQVDGGGQIRVFVDAGTRKGRYRFLAIRDSRSSSPSNWIAVDVTVDVK